MSTKTALFEGLTGEIVPGAGSNSSEITDPSLFMSVRVQGMAQDDALALMKQDFTGTGWVRYSEKGLAVVLTAEDPSEIPLEKGVYALKGTVTGTVTAYTEV